MTKKLLRESLEAVEEAQTYTERPTFSPSMTRDLERVAVKLRAAIDAPEQEPVAWVYHDGAATELIPGEMFGTVFASMKKVSGMKNELPLYAKPQPLQGAKS